ncbi:MAG: hypothetical protein Ta2D_12780 [Rickettsiales bacterium]|nr:MAG: hypothetical protein Ta2D_12780 [Rickettsiales bacterium]
MYNILFIGLNDFTKKVIANVSRSNYIITGFDFNDMDKMDEFFNENLIINKVEYSTKEIFENAKIIILNIETKDYSKLAKYFPYIDKETLIININSYKGNTMQIRQNLDSFTHNFISTNLILLPEKIIFNIDDDTNLLILKKADNFLKSFGKNILQLSYKENDFLFSIYYLFYIFQIVFFKNSKINFVPINDEIIKEDILLHSKNIVAMILKIINLLNNLDNLDKIKKLITNNNLPIVLNDLGIDLTNENMTKILLEKFVIETTLKNESLDNFFELDINFAIKLYKQEKILAFLEKNDMSFMLFLINEKLKNLINILNFTDLTFEKLDNYLKML